MRCRSDFMYKRNCLLKDGLEILVVIVGLVLGLDRFFLLFLLNFLGNFRLLGCFCCCFCARFFLHHCCCAGRPSRVRPNAASSDKSCNLRTSAIGRLSRDRPWLDRVVSLSTTLLPACIAAVVLAFLLHLSPRQLRRQHTQSTR